MSIPPHLPLQLLPAAPHVSPPAAGEAARVALVMLHGLGMDPQVLRPFVASLALPAPACVPTGPARTADGAPCWWPVDAARRAQRLAAGPCDLFDRRPAGRLAARRALGAVLRQVDAATGGLPIVLAGFSQGGMLALDYALLGDADDAAPARSGGDEAVTPPSPRPAALALFSTSCIALDEWRPRLSRLAGLPALVAHGRDDDDLAFAAGERVRDTLAHAGAQVRWLPFDGGHGLPLVAWRALRRFVVQCADAPAPLAEAA